MISNCLKYFRINTNSVILKLSLSGPLAPLSGVNGPLVEKMQKSALRVSPRITDLY